MRLVAGPIVGETTDKFARIWIATSTPGVIEGRLFRDAALRKPVPSGRFSISTTSADGNTGTAKIGLPRPDTEYYYDLTSNGASLVTSTIGAPSFVSATDPKAPADFRFGLVSCHNPWDYAGSYPKHNMWSKLEDVGLAKRLSFILYAGDQFYGDVHYEDLIKHARPDEQQALEEYRAGYRKYWKHEAVRRVMARFPSYMIWDDHEIRDGWGSNRYDRMSANRYAIFKGARKAYEEFQHSHNPDTKQGTYHYGFLHGGCGFYVLDLRGKRNVARKRVNYPLLGRSQWTDFRIWLRRNAGKIGALFIVTSVPLVHAPSIIADVLGGDLIGNENLIDQWSYKKNRREQELVLDEMFNFANEQDVPVTVLGGDVHVGTTACIRSFRESHRRRPRIYQFTSSPISNQPEGKFNKLLQKSGLKIKVGDYAGRIMDPVVDGRNFGVVSVQWDQGRAMVGFDLHEEGKGSPLPFHV